MKKQFLLTAEDSRHYISTLDDRQSIILSSTCLVQCRAGSSPTKKELQESTELCNGKCAYLRHVYTTHNPQFHLVQLCNVLYDLI